MLSVSYLSNPGQQECTAQLQRNLILLQIRFIKQSIPEFVFLDILYDSDSSSEEPESELDTVKQNADIMEQEAFDSVAPALKEILTADNLSADYLFFKQSKTDNIQYSSVYLFNENKHNETFLKRIISL